MSCSSHGITGKNKENGIADTALKEEEFKNKLHQERKY